MVSVDSSSAGIKHNLLGLIKGKNVNLFLKEIIEF